MPRSCMPRCVTCKSTKHAGAPSAPSEARELPGAPKLAPGFDQVPVARRAPLAHIRSRGVQPVTPDTREERHVVAGPGVGRATLMVGWVWARQGTSSGEGL